MFGERDGMNAVSLFYYQYGLLAVAASFFCTFGRVSAK